MTSASSTSQYYTYRLQTYENLPANTDYEVVLTTQEGDGTEGIHYPTSRGTYQVAIEVKYSSSNSQLVSSARYVTVGGTHFKLASVISTIDIPGALNFIIIEAIPGETLYSYHQLLLEIPTVALDGTTLFPADLGMGYEDYDELVFDLFESSVSSMSCKVYTGDAALKQPVRIACSNFNADVGTGNIVRFGFWTRNPTTTVSLAIPMMFGNYRMDNDRFRSWSFVEAAIRVIPSSQTPIADSGNFASSSTYRQISNQHLDLTTRNSKSMKQGDLYILKFNFDLRNEQKQAGAFKYNSGFTETGDIIFMRNCRTILLRIGATDLATVTSGSAGLNARIQSEFYNPPTQLATS